MLADDEFHFDLLVSRVCLNVATVHAQVLLKHDDNFAVLDLLHSRLSRPGIRN
jgi:hypothetical protein